MSLSSRLPRLITTVVAIVCGCVLLGATSWSLLRVIESGLQAKEKAQITNDRRSDYKATATALTVDDNEARAEVESGIVLLQQVFETSTPAPVELESNATPAPLELPKLVAPRNPSAGLELSGTAVPRPASIVARDYDLVNIILLGADDELTDDNFIRTDTMIIVSLNRDTGTVSMVNLPRDLFLYIPSGRMGRLNIAYGIGENLNWQPDGGFGLLRQTIFYNFGINVHYYARANFTGFKAIIDHLGGVEIAVDCRYRDLYPVARMNPDAGDDAGFAMRTLETGYYTFDGYDALWYARTRRLTDDLDRGRRQQQLLRAMWRKARANGLIAAMPALWGDISETVDTNLPLDIMLGLLPQLINLDLADVDNYTFTRRYHTLNWRTPAGYAVLLPQAEEVAKLMQDFYTPPAPHQSALASPSVRIYNASGNKDWDRVASERLRWDGHNAVAMGSRTEDGVVQSSRLIDYAAASKGSLVPKLLRALNLRRDQVETKANPAREVDYEIILGADYDSCTYGVLPIKN